MKYDDWLTEKVLQTLLEVGNNAGPIAYGSRGGADTSGSSIYGDKIDPLLPRAPGEDGEYANPDDLLLGKKIEEAGKKEIVLTWDTLPQPSVTELQWADPTSAERKELESFLRKVGGSTLGEKLRNIQDAINGNLFTKRTAMSTVLSYLVFLKTLTYIITSFNSASAGFTFESFLGVLLGGRQIAAGGNTIADYETAQGEFVSLKLLGVKGSEGTDSASTIDGSFTQLIDDLSGDSIDSGGKMKYVIALKDLQGKGDKMGGTITVYEFTFSRDNLAHLMSLSPKSMKAFSLIDPKYRERWDEEDYKIEFVTYLERYFTEAPGKQIEPGSVTAIRDAVAGRSGLADPKNYMAAMFALLNKLGLTDLAEEIKKANDGLTSDPSRAHHVEKKIRSSEAFENALANYVAEKAGDTVAASEAFASWKKLPAKEREATDQPPADGAWGYDTQLDPVDKRVKSAAIALWSKDTEGHQSPAKSTDIKKGEFTADQGPKGKQKMIMSFEASKAELAAIESDEDYYQHIKNYSMGYNSKGEPQFSISQNDVIGGRTGNKMPIGELTVGRESVEKAIKQSVTDINEKMFTAFNKMSELSTSLQNFFLKGLRSQDGADAIGATKGIAKDTGDIMKKKNK